MNKQQAVGVIILLLSFYVFFIKDPSVLNSLVDSWSKPASEFYGCKAFPFLMIFIIEAVVVFALLTSKKKRAPRK